MSLSKEKVSVTWTSHLKTDEEKEKFLENLGLAYIALERLRTIADDKIEATNKVKRDDYSKPSWAYEQADRNGYARAWRDIKDLTKHTTTKG